MGSLRTTAFHGHCEALRKRATVPFLRFSGSERKCMVDTCMRHCASTRCVSAGTQSQPQRTGRVAPGVNMIPSKGDRTPTALPKELHKRTRTVVLTGAPASSSCCSTAKGAPFIVATQSSVVRHKKGTANRAVTAPHCAASAAGSASPRSGQPYNPNTANRYGKPFPCPHSNKVLKTQKSAPTQIIRVVVVGKEEPTHAGTFRVAPAAHRASMTSVWKPFPA